MKEQWYKEYYVRYKFNGEKCFNTLKLYISEPKEGYDILYGVWKHAPEWKCGTDCHWDKEKCYNIIHKHLLDGYGDPIIADEVDTSQSWYKEITEDVQVIKSTYFYPSDKSTAYFYAFTVGSGHYFASYFPEDEERTVNKPIYRMDTDKCPDEIHGMLDRPGSDWVEVSYHTVTIQKYTTVSYDYVLFPYKVEVRYSDPDYHIKDDIFVLTYTLNEEDY